MMNLSVLTEKSNIIDFHFHFHFFSLALPLTSSDVSFLPVDNEFEFDLSVPVI